MNDDARFDLHLHSAHSPDSSMPVSAIVEAVAGSGLRGCALTDHNTVAGLHELAEAQREYRGYLFIPGVEISTREGHLLAYGLDTTPPVRRALAETIEWVDAHGGVAVPSHPYRRGHGIGNAAALSCKVPCLEGRNGHSTEFANARAELVAAQRALGTTGGSDAHTPRDVGRAYTIFSEGIETVDDLLDALRRGRCRGEGRSLAGVDRLRVGLRNIGLRAARAFRPI
ncbi:MAG: PHP domain-containing protein [Thermoplasmata archaeon]